MRQPDVQAQLSVRGGRAAPAHGNVSPRPVGGATTRMLLLVDDPEHVLAQARAAGARQVSPVPDEHRWRLGRIDDPFGHRREIGTPVGGWPPPGRRGRAS